MDVKIKAQPYSWPYQGGISSKDTALVIIDMQTDFCGQGGYIDKMGYDISLTANAIQPIASVLECARSIPGFMVIHTREGHRPDLSDLPENKRWRSAMFGAEIGSDGPLGRILVRGEPGWDIIEDLKPIDGEIVIDKPGKGAFYSTDLDLILRTRGIKNLILTGVTTDVCVHTTMREANDRGYECVILEDCTGATDYQNHLFALNMVKMQNGVFGCVSHSGHVNQALSKMMSCNATNSQE